MGSASSRSRPPSSVGSASQISSPSASQKDNSPKKEKDSKNERFKSESKKETVPPKPGGNFEEEEEGEEDREGKDIMISYSHADKEMMQKVRSFLEEEGFSVWVDVVGLTAGVNFLTKIGQAVIDCKVLISLLSEKTIKSRCCQDELALAYVSQKPIFPIGLQTPQELMPLMDTGMRLQLARFDWFLLTNPKTFEENMADFVVDLRAHFHSSGFCHTCSHGQTDDLKRSPKKVAGRKGKTLKRQLTVKNIPIEAEVDFWENNFDDSMSVEWSRFEETFNNQNADALKERLGISNISWPMEILKRELDVKFNEGMVTKESYQAFCTLDGEECPFLSRVEDQVVESYCMKEVFNMESSVRVEAIENLARFRSAAVIEALLDLLDDPDNNVITVAAISLAKTEDNSPKIIRKLMTCLESDDRLVRESGALALGHLKAGIAVPKLVHLWRNDFISSVRDACQLALEQIGGEEANQAIHITNVLAEEIRSLTK